jgi:hypothetical protein
VWIYLINTFVGVRSTANNNNLRDYEGAPTKIHFTSYTHDLLHSVVSSAKR